MAIGRESGRTKWMPRKTAQADDLTSRGTSANHLGRRRLSRQRTRRRGCSTQRNIFGGEEEGLGLLFMNGGNRLPTWSACVSLVRVVGVLVGAVVTFRLHDRHIGKIAHQIFGLALEFAGV